MKKQKLTLTLMSGLSILMMFTACRQAKPSSASTPIPGLAETLAAAQTRAAQQTALAGSATPPATSTPRISPITNTSLTVREDQTTLFVDHKAGIQLVIPADWLAVRVNEDEYYKAFSLDKVLNSQPIKDRLTGFQSLNADFFRLGAIDTRPEHVADEVAPDITVIFAEGDHRDFTKWLQAERSNKKPFKGYKFLGSAYQATTDGTRVLVIEESWNVGPSGTLYYRGVFFSLPSGTVVLDLQVNKEFKDAVLLDFEQVMNSLAPLTP